MNPSPPPVDETVRVRQLHELRILDTDDEPQFAAIARLASLNSGCPIGALSFVDADRQWFKASVGLKVRETPRHTALCSRAILSASLTVLNELQLQPDFAGNPLLDGDSPVRFYAAAPVVIDGQRVGTVCCMDHHARQFDDAARRALGELAELAAALLQARLRERRSRVQEARVRTASRAARDWLWETNAAGRLTWLSDNLLLRDGRCPRHVIGEPWLHPYEPLAVLRPADWARCVAAFSRREPFGDVLTDCHTPHGAMTVSSNGQPVFDTAGTFMGFRGASRDVSAELQVKQSLAASEERWKFALEGGGQGVWDWDGRKKGLYFSEAWKAIVGHVGSEVGTGLDEWMKRMHPEDLGAAKAKLFAHMRGETSMYIAEHRMRHKSGHDVWVLNRGKIVRRSQSGRAVRMVGTLIDVTAQHNADAILRDKRAADLANHAKTEFLSRMSHEMRTPLNAVIGFSQLLLSRPGDPSTREVRDYAEHVLRAGEHLLALINDVLDLQCVEQGRMALEPSNVQLDDMVSQVIHLLSSAALERGVAFDNHLPPGIVVRADERRLRQVLLNVASNAVKYNRPAGVVRWSADSAAGPTRVRLSIEDSGSGLAPAQLERLFQPFERLGKETSTIEGTGLGLIIARSLTAAMGGSLEVVSRSGEGTRVVVDLPRGDCSAVRAAESEAPSVTSAALPSPALRMLYVEDNRINAIVFEEALRLRDGMELRLAEDGVEALDRVRDWRPDVLVLDSHLPGMNGFELLRALRDRAGLVDVPAFMCSADAMPDDIRRAAEAGFTGYWPKPIDIAQIMADLDQLCAGLPACVAARQV
ncbi:ATP-binding protein [Piscinibacter sp.]|jgi:PAS domain S-box-containing protein|uniref:ATP-binding protein n=1 Tax=Piscinibacter sp. TaxID=1903157 RepID=UPI00355A6B6A